MNPIDFMTEPLHFDFMTRALMATIAAGIVCALLSCWLVLVGWSLMGDAVSHAVLPGVVIGYTLSIPFAIGASIAGLLAVALIGTVHRTGRIREDTSMGIVFTTMFALGLVLISVTPSNTDLQHIVFGNVLGVSSSDLRWLLILTAAITAVAVLTRRDLTLWAFDPTHLRVIGLSPRRIEVLLLTLLALTTVVALQVVGVVLVVALLIIPGATARLLTDRFARMLWIAPTMSVLCGTIGVYISYWYDTATGATVVVVHGMAFAIAWLLAPRYGAIRRALDRRRITAARQAAR